MSRLKTQVAVAKRKEAHPEMYCPKAGCLWNTAAQGGGYCPRHSTATVTQ